MIFNSIYNVILFLFNFKGKLKKKYFVKVKRISFFSSLKENYPETFEENPYKYLYGIFQLLPNYLKNNQNFYAPLKYKIV